VACWCEVSLEQALQEVCEESEAAALAAQSDEYSQRRTAELAEAQRVLAAEQRRTQEIERRKKQAIDDTKAAQLVLCCALLCPAAVPLLCAAH
jgi:hypothetical protein